MKCRQLGSKTCSFEHCTVLFILRPYWIFLHLKGSTVCHCVSTETVCKQGKLSQKCKCHRAAMPPGHSQKAMLLYCLASSQQRHCFLPVSFLFLPPNHQPLLLPVYLRRLHILGASPPNLTLCQIFTVMMLCNKNTPNLSGLQQQILTFLALP